MPKLRVLRKPEDAKDLPTDKPVQVELPAAEALEESVGEAVGTGESTPAPRTEPEPDHAILSLQKQIEDLKKANEENATRYSEAERQRQEAQRLAEERQGEISRLSERTADAEGIAISNAIVAAQAEAENAYDEIRQARTVEDATREREAMRRLARAEAKLEKYETAKEEFETRKKAPPKPQQQNQQQIMPSEQEWINKHPNALSDQRLAIKLDSAFRLSQVEGLRRGSPEYFAFLDEQLGFAKKPEPKPEETTIEVVEEEEPNRSVIVSAPPSKTVPSSTTGKATPTRITLSPEQLEHAKAAGVDPLVYAQNLIKLQQAKKDGLLQ